MDALGAICVPWLASISRIIHLKEYSGDRTLLLSKEDWSTTTGAILVTKSLPSLLTWDPFVLGKDQEWISYMASWTGQPRAWSSSLPEAGSFQWTTIMDWSRIWALKTERPSTLTCRSWIGTTIFCTSFSASRNLFSKKIWPIFQLRKAAFADCGTSVGPCTSVCSCFRHGSLSRGFRPHRPLGPSAYPVFTSWRWLWNRSSSLTECPHV